MDFQLSDIHTDLAATVDAMLGKADMPAAARAWAAGDRTAVAKVYSQLADAGVCGLLIDESHGGSSAGAVEMVVAVEQLGRHCAPGPIVESVAVLPILLRDADVTGPLNGLAEGRLATCAIAPLQPLAPDVESADVYVVSDGVLSTATVLSTEPSVDTTRTLSRVAPDKTLATGVDPSDAVDAGALATAAELLGLGQAMLAQAGEYAQSRKQFGRAIGSFQAVKHHLADVAIALEMARPLVHAAALGIDGQVPEETNVSRDVSAAKVAAADAAHLSARRSLQVLGAIGYTAEHDISLYITKTRALLSAWGSPAVHRRRILETL
ncbi:acyl-CoA dehydrogenase family protein [Gordonia amicalis]|uniref:acyl-CoA dehydrogenase family protein n=1 Tax=Gordonia amicalis TaxID=89053 RepID=UPI0002A629F0|nr:acyl-CoA dehydrogenase family protein [Gordonia amicalis]MBA5848986.1 acyl-CoA/acyl-ACP dehydrogenase [Gordonia amicalis]MDV7099527.1 acyl-CoA dehydrogenase family protein [Gordonia amicalis]NKX77820.1 acyl-CoA/acyl-ACP dehydrogenase [Gordonia amicalis]UOG20771.1 acyl-CoA/acyl-ACP dehydrogenase [Gordonia amicalis]GAC52698.1 putative acyl-CoA dehydrogenase [Gordonia amicalis NBRC 100051 = JCM 11271]